MKFKTPWFALLLGTVMGMPAGCASPAIDTADLSRSLLDRSHDRPNPNRSHARRDKTQRVAQNARPPRRADSAPLADSVHRVGSVHHPDIVDHDRPIRQVAHTQQHSQAESPQDYYHRLGIDAAVAGQFDKAHQHFKRAAASGPPTAELLNDIGRLFFLQGRTADAERALREAVAVDGNCLVAHQNLAMVRDSVATAPTALNHAAPRPLPPPPVVAPPRPLAVQPPIGPPLGATPPGYIPMTAGPPIPPQPNYVLTWVPVQPPIVYGPPAMPWIPQQQPSVNPVLQPLAPRAAPPAAPQRQPSLMSVLQPLVPRAAPRASQPAEIPPQFPNPLKFLGTPESSEPEEQSAPRVASRPTARQRIEDWATSSSTDDQPISRWSNPKPISDETPRAATAARRKPRKVAVTDDQQDFTDDDPRVADTARRKPRKIAVTGDGQDFTDDHPNPLVADAARRKPRKVAVTDDQQDLEPIAPKRKVTVARIPTTKNPEPDAPPAPQAKTERKSEPRGDRPSTSKHRRSIVRREVEQPAEVVTERQSESRSEGRNTIKLKPLPANSTEDEAKPLAPTREILEHPLRSSKSRSKPVDEPGEASAVSFVEMRDVEAKSTSATLRPFSWRRVGSN